MASLNRVHILGSLVHDPELRFTPSHKGVLSFMLDVEGEFENFFPITVWGKLADICNQQLKKGSRIYLEGRLLVSNKTVTKTMSTFDEEEFEIEEDKYSVQIVAKRVEFLDSQQPNRSTIKETIENVVAALEGMAIDPMADRMMIRYLVNELNSLDLENTD